MTGSFLTMWSQAPLFWKEPGLSQNIREVMTTGSSNGLLRFMKELSAPQKSPPQSGGMRKDTSPANSHLRKERNWRHCPDALKNWSRSTKESMDRWVIRRFTRIQGKISQMQGQGLMKLIRS